MKNRYNWLTKDELTTQKTIDEINKKIKNYRSEVDKLNTAKNKQLIPNIELRIELLKTNINADEAELLVYLNRIKTIRNYKNSISQQMIENGCPRSLIIP